MEHRDVERLLTVQQGVIAAWQMADAGVTPKAIAWQVRRMRRVHSGVYLSGHAPLTDRQRWWAAVVTAPGSLLSHISAAALHGFGDEPSQVVTITRLGRGPRVRRGDLLVSYRAGARPDARRYDGLLVTTPGQTLADLAGHVDVYTLRRMVRDALRLGTLDAAALRRAVRKARCRPGVPVLRACLAEYGSLAVATTKGSQGAGSDAEVVALVLLQQAHLPEPALNVRRAGWEADLSWRDQRLIVELDGASFHQFPGEDALRDDAWAAAGWTVVRIPTDVVYNDPAAFLAVVRSALN